MKNLYEVEIKYTRESFNGYCYTDHTTRYVFAKDGEFACAKATKWFTKKLGLLVDSVEAKHLVKEEDIIT